MRELPLWQVILIGFVLVMAGFVLAWLLALRVVPSTFLLNLVAYAMSIVGLMIGLVGSAWYVAQSRRRRGP